MIKCGECKYWDEDHEVAKNEHYIFPLPPKFGKCVKIENAYKNVRYAWLVDAQACSEVYLLCEPTFGCELGEEGKIEEGQYSAYEEYCKVSWEERTKLRVEKVWEAKKHRPYITAGSH